MGAGKTAIVTGSTSGIGLGIATALAGSGTNIVLNGFGPADEIDKIVDGGWAAHQRLTAGSGLLSH